MELGDFNVRVNAICPGSVAGDRMERVIEAKAKNDRGFRTRIATRL
jgi:NAD(P)-dependent dehydrogenase (short-subunit alcohol dehydrogenase family)